MTMGRSLGAVGGLPSRGKEAQTHIHTKNHIDIHIQIYLKLKQKHTLTDTHI